MASVDLHVEAHDLKTAHDLTTSRQPEASRHRSHEVEREMCFSWEVRYKASWKREFNLPWREAGPPNHLDDKVDSDQYVVNKEISL